MKFIHKGDIKKFVIFILTVVFIFGVYGTIYITKKIERDERKNLLLRADTIASLIDRDSILKLKGDESDIESDYYKVLKQQMTTVHDINVDTRFVYLMGLKDSKQFFFVDSENSSSKDYSPPGQVYPDSQEKDIYNHRYGIAYTKGPYVDQWGKWFSAYAPVFGSNKEVIALVGMDIDAEKLLLRIAIVRNTAIFLFGLIFASLLSVFLLTKESRRKIEERFLK